MTDWKTNLFGAPKEYDQFVADMKLAAKMDKLPTALSREDTENVKLDDLRDMILAVRHDTGLEVEATFFVCTACSKLHLMLIVDFPEEDDVFPVVQ